MAQREKTVIKVNSNFHHIAGEDLFGQDAPQFKAYRSKWKNWPETFHADVFPLFIDIEVTSVCNLRCYFCATTYRSKFIKKGYISFPTVKKIIDEGEAHGLYGVKFNIRGEPLLHSRIHDFVAYAKNKGLIDVYFNTNALLLTEEISRKLIDAGLDRISVSFEGYTKDVYEKYRVNSNYEMVLKNIEDMQSLKRKLNIEYPKVRVQAVMLPGVVGEVDAYKAFWSARADEVVFIDYKEMKKKRQGIRYAWACPQLWQRMAVWWDGTILPCNHDDDGLIILGNVNDTTIKEAWNSRKLNSIRELHKKGMAHRIRACDGCYLRDSEIAKLKEAGEKT